MVQLTVEERTFLVKNFFETGSLKVTRERFAERFTERRPLALKTIWERKSSRKFSAPGTTLNRNKVNSVRQRTGRPKANIEAARGPNDLNDLQNRIQNEVDALRNVPALIRRTLHAIRRRCELCIERDGGHVEGIGE